MHINLNCFLTQSKLYWYRGSIKKSMELIWEKIWKRVVKKNRWKKPGKNFIIPWAGEKL
jgi:hypothetical protein